MPDPELIVAPTLPPVSVALEPAHYALNDLSLLVKTEKLSGLDEWVMRTADSLTPERRHTNRLVSVGFYYAITPDRSWPNFPVYIDHLAAQNPEALRHRLFNRHYRE